MKKGFYIIIGLILVVLALVISNSSSDGNQSNESNLWAGIRASDIAQLDEDWGEPIRLEVNTVADWEDGVYISGDGNTLYFVIYPGDLINDLQAGEYKDDIDIYYSQKPFNTRQLHYLSEDIWSEGGVMISGNDIYYMSNKMAKEDVNKKPVNDNIYRNNEKLSFNTDNESLQDPHYCAAKDELYFWKSTSPEFADFEPGDIYVYKNNQVIKLPAPINSVDTDMQPFLTNDCQTMYFTSGRAGVGAIYKSNRLGENSWSNPEVIISSKFGVGEPTLTDDQSQIFFLQVFISADNRFTTDIFYANKK